MIMTVVPSDKPTAVPKADTTVATNLSREDVEGLLLAPLLDGPPYDTGGAYHACSTRNTNGIYRAVLFSKRPGRQTVT